MLQLRRVHKALNAPRLQPQQAARASVSGLTETQVARGNEGVVVFLLLLLLLLHPAEL